VWVLDAAELPTAVRVRALAVLAGAAAVMLCLRLALRNSSGFSGRISGPRGAAALGLPPSTLEARIKKAEDSQEPIQAWPVVKRIRHILWFPQFHKIRTASVPPPSCIFNHFKMAFYVHPLRHASIHAMLAGKARG
jgi:hypothetical protein